MTRITVQAGLGRVFADFDDDLPGDDHRLDAVQIGAAPGPVDAWVRRR